MGGSSSKTTSTVITEILADLISQHTTDCSTNATVEQKVNYERGGFIAIGSKIKVVQNVRMSVECFQKVLQTNNINSMITAAVQQAAKAVDGGFGLTSGASSADQTIIKNISSTTIKTDDIVKSYSTICQAQDVKIKDSYTVSLASGTEILQGTELIVKALQSNSTVNDLVNQAATQIDQNADSESKNGLSDIVNSLGKIFGTLMSGAIIYWIGLIILILGVLYIGQKTFLGTLLGYDTQQTTSGSAGSAEYMATFVDEM